MGQKLYKMGDKSAFLYFKKNTNLSNLHCL